MASEQAEHLVKFPMKGPPTKGVAGCQQLREAGSQPTESTAAMPAGGARLGEFIPKWQLTV